MATRDSEISARQLLSLSFSISISLSLSLSLSLSFSLSLWNIRDGWTTATTTIFRNSFASDGTSEGHLMAHWCEALRDERKKWFCGCGWAVPEALRAFPELCVPEKRVLTGVVFEWALGRGCAQKKSIFRVQRFTEWPWPLHWIAFLPVEVLTKSPHSPPIDTYIHTYIYTCTVTDTDTHTHTHTHTPPVRVHVHLQINLGLSSTSPKATPDKATLPDVPLFPVFSRQPSAFLRPWWGLAQTKSRQSFKPTLDLLLLWYLICTERDGSLTGHQDPDSTPDPNVCRSFIWFCQNPPRQTKPKMAEWRVHSRRWGISWIRGVLEKPEKFTKIGAFHTTFVVVVVVNSPSCYKGKHPGFTKTPIFANRLANRPFLGWFSWAGSNSGLEKRILTKETWFPFTAVGAIFALVRISVRGLVADRKSLLRNSGIGGGGGNLILIRTSIRPVIAFADFVLGGFEICSLLQSPWVLQSWSGEKKKDKLERVQMPIKCLSSKFCLPPPPQGTKEEKPYTICTTASKLTRSSQAWRNPKSQDTQPSLTPRKAWTTDVECQTPARSTNKKPKFL